MWLAVLDLPMNLYPVLLQRDHRHRLQELLSAGKLAHGSEVLSDRPRDGST
jgi:hypothetical protein